MKIVFLDIDGVMNSMRNCLAQDGRSRPFDPEAMSALNRILRETGAKICVSSMWRRSGASHRSLVERIKRFDDMLVLEGLPEGSVINMTPVLESTVGGVIIAQPRRDEIAAWLNEHPEVTAWVALDDDKDAGPLNLIYCDDGDGLTEALADQAIALLNSSLA